MIVTRLLLRAYLGTLLKSDVIVVVVVSVVDVVDVEVRLYKVVTHLEEQSVFSPKQKEPIHPSH